MTNVKELLAATETAVGRALNALYRGEPAEAADFLEGYAHNWLDAPMLGEHHEREEWAAKHAEEGS